MRVIHPALLFLIFSTPGMAQDKVIDRLVVELCDTLGQIPYPIEDINAMRYGAVFYPSWSGNFAEFREEMSAYTETTGLTDHDYMLWLEHKKQLHCAAYRKANLIMDHHLKGKKAFRPYYVNAKKFVFGLEGDPEYQNLETFFDKKLWSDSTRQLLKELQLEIDRIADHCILDLRYLPDRGRTFRVQYLDALTKTPLLQIDLITQEHSDLLIDRLEVKNKEQLRVVLEALEKKKNGPSIWLTPAEGNKKNNY